MFSRCVARSVAVRASTARPAAARSFSSLRPSSLRLAAAAATPQTKITFNWQEKAQGVPPKLAASYKAAASYIDELQTAASANFQVPTIDWAAWEREIKTPGVVAKLRAEYESMKFEAKAVSEEEIKKKNEQYDESIKQAENRVVIAKKREAAARERLAKLQKLHGNVGENTLQDFYNFVPGIEEELRQQWWDGHYLADPDEQKNQAFDPRPVIEYFQKGGTLHEFPDSFLSSLAIPQKVGSTDYLTEWKKAEKEIQEMYPGEQLPAVQQPKFRLPKDHHELLDILEQRRLGAPIFGAPLPGQPEGGHH